MFQSFFFLKLFLHFISFEIIAPLTISFLQIFSCRFDQLFQIVHVKFRIANVQMLWDFQMFFVNSLYDIIRHSSSEQIHKKWKNIGEKWSQSSREA